MAKKKETEFEKLARLLKEEGEDIRTEIKGEIKGLEYKMNEGFTRVERRLDTIVQPQLDNHARRIKILEVKTAAHR